MTILLKIIKFNSLIPNRTLYRLPSILFCCFFLMYHTGWTQSCSCIEYIYLNETSGGGKVHKFQTNADGSFNEVQTNGGAWYPGSGESELTAPHGLGTDLNGFLYIAEAIWPASTSQDIRRLTCDGEIFLESDFKIDAVGFNFVTIGNKLYNNPPDWGEVGDTLYAYDLCTGGSLVDHLCLNHSGTRLFDWGMTKDANDVMYSTGQTGGVTHVWRYTEADFANTDCIDPWLVSSPSGSFPSPGDKFLPPAPAQIRGITVPGDGFMYIVDWAIDEEDDLIGSRVLKYTETGEFVLASPLDTSADMSGYYEAHGVVYSEVNNLLYISTTSPLDDCVAIIDPATMTYVGAAVPFVNETTRSKGIAIQKECCPTNNNLTIDKTLCAMSINQTIFLQELIDCDGIICEGTWQEGTGNTGLTYNSCNNSVTIDALNGCGTFTLGSTGAGNNAQCGVFEITINIEIKEVNAPIIAGTQALCSSDAPAPFTVSSAATGSGTITYQWQESSEELTGYTNIVGAATATYQAPAGIVNTTYYRVIASVADGCSSESCSDTSNVVQLTVGEQPEVECEYRLQKQVDWITGDCSPMLCLDGRLELSATPNNYTSYEWSGPNGFNGRGDANGNLLISNCLLADQAGTYTVTVTNENGCTGTTSIDIGLKDCPCNLNSTVSNQTYLDNNTTDVQQHTFTYQLDISGSGEQGWLLYDVVSGNTHEIIDRNSTDKTLNLGPFPVDQNGSLYILMNAENTACFQSIGVNMNSCVYTGACNCCSN